MPRNGKGEAEDEAGGGVQSVERAFEILEVIAKHGGNRDPRYLAETIVRERITAVDFVPSMLELFLDEPAAGMLRRLYV